MKGKNEAKGLLLKRAALALAFVLTVCLPAGVAFAGEGDADADAKAAESAVPAQGAADPALDQPQQVSDADDASELLVAASVQGEYAAGTIPAASDSDITDDAAMEAKMWTCPRIGTKPLIISRMSLTQTT